MAINHLITISIHMYLLHLYTDPDLLDPSPYQVSERNSLRSCKKLIKQEIQIAICHLTIHHKHITIASISEK